MCEEEVGTRGRACGFRDLVYLAFDPGRLEPLVCLPFRSLPLSILSLSILFEESVTPQARKNEALHPCYSSTLQSAVYYFLLSPGPRGLGQDSREAAGWGAFGHGRRSSLTVGG